MPHASAKTSGVGSTKPKESKLTSSEWVRALIGLGILFFCGRWAYKEFLAPDEPPVVLGSDSLGAAQLDTILATAKANELRFKSEFAGKQFSASGQFKEANKDLRRYHIAVTIRSKEVACETMDPQTLNLVSKLSVGQPVRIYGLIEDTWMGDLQLKRCAVAS
jgi:hypothetical protein